jgi:hypothetical protein
MISIFSNIRFIALPLIMDIGIVTFVSCLIFKTT